MIFSFFLYFCLCIYVNVFCGITVLYVLQYPWSVLSVNAADGNISSGND